MNQPAAPGKSGTIIHRFLEILEKADYDALDEVCTADVIQEIPQSGERVRGLDNFRAVFENYPGRAPGRSSSGLLHIVGDEPHYVMTPTFTMVRVEGTGESPTAIWKARYPDGSRWWVVALITMRGGKMAKMVSYFAQEFAPPEWRTHWVERMESIDHSNDDW